jgi:hypothetical protein
MVQKGFLKTLLLKKTDHRKLKSNGETVQCFGTYEYKYIPVAENIGNRWIHQTTGSGVPTLWT